MVSLSNKIRAILEAIRDDILPLTEKMVAEGNHVFGGAVLRADTLETVVAGSNARVENPIYHGEIDAIRRFFALEAHPSPDDCIFVATHEPCPMCASAIAWAGFSEIWVLFGYEDVERDFGMPVDLAMYRDIFGAEGARAENSFFRKYLLPEEAAKCPDSEGLLNEIESLNRRYRSLKVKDFRYPGMSRSG